MSNIPTQVFLTKGVGKHREKLQSFEMALRDAGIAQYNLVRVSSIFPPGCRIISRREGNLQLKPGQVVFCVLSDNATDEPHRLCAASVGLSIPKDRTHYGYLSEHHGFGQTEKQAGDYAEDLAAEMLATVLGVKFEAAKSWNQRQDTWTISGEIVRTLNVTQSSVGDKEGLWTTVVCGAIFVP
ncbi:MAG: arginine decarboxylase, pyruvoyl-dependent [Deltaproteobacteria bacterium CG11_big_fil_rev_8_21_14_0_20_49_13]|nr:MAG: arginine decarboxylase, pyruvoyl-dependent [Deltaproteobacteria bacterium CG11_big_fil_rev_8_21_14_0_20_49_13]